ncbi:XdhC family protein [Sulfitobacter donghicola]|uniref:Carbon monoxide dehydrogenase F protein n=1 Tax=Sulfitobacter donghicola DSW-25 = KCTC 12864 = JCM 14565 TaxID=1300350 RepID=A0A073IHT6_9RHOB|nr:XdhC family protein [Sulfitobacter donghicola]KEJ89041.1 carbon monoxide dehydrogenase F protein [Sulfitobacter donghicola DSW-25 = KCTC 12864 = JCM 14565]KIN67391.1 Carbon monoxide dehydrogenase F protein [Sulfitobacter donghicola DSW-25 = KCTC 12864 = JCM 14565]
MTPKQIMEHGLNEGEKCFAIATIVRTTGTTSAKPGAKALMREDGTILEGWLGGGCVRGAIKDATLRAYATGQPQFISVAPQEELAEKGVRAGDDVDGVRFARNGCPSKGTIDIFIEPHLPKPDLLVFGESPVAKKLIELAPQFGWGATTVSADAPLPPRTPSSARYLVIATQGQGDLAALKTGLADLAEYIAFVGSTKKFTSLSEKLIAAGADPAQIATVRAPAGLDIGAVTPAEIALAILAELTQVKRDLLARLAQNG